jgi:zinc protease
MNRILATALLAASLHGPALAAVGAPAPLPVPPPAPVTPEVRTLASGLRVAVVRDTRQPIVQIQLRLPAGTAAEPERHPGVATLTGQLVRMGTSSRSAEQYERELGRHGITLGVTVGRDAAIVAMGMERGALASGFELLADAVRNPVFAPEPFEVSRRVMAQQLGQQLQSPAVLADERAAEAFYSPHPYSRPALGSLDALLQMDPESVRGFHRERWRPDRALLAIAGDVTADEAFRLAEEWFGGWAGRASADRPAPAPAAPQVRVVDVPSAPYSEVRVGVVTPGRGDGRWPSWQLAHATLEGGGLPAGARASLTGHRDAGLLLLAAPARHDSVAAVAARLRAALAGLADPARSGPALAATRRRVAQALPLQLESMGSRLTQWMLDDLSGLGSDGPERLQRALLAADLAPLADALRRPAPVLVVAPAVRVRAALAALGPVEEQALQRTLTSAPADTLPAPDAEQVRLGREAIAAAVAAHGGERALRAVRTLVTEGEIELLAGGQPISGTFTAVRAFPDRFAYVTKLVGLEVRQVLVGDSAWTLTVGDTARLEAVSPEGVETLRTSLVSDPVSLLLAALAPEARPALRDRESMDGEPAVAVDFRSPRGPVRLMLDARTHRLLAADGVFRGERWLERRRFRQPVRQAGLLLPGLEERIAEGQVVSRIRLRRAATQVALDPGLFRRPRVIGGQLLDP